MAEIGVTIPRMLADLVNGDRRFIVEAATVGGVLAAVADRHPEFGVHLFDARGTMREHVSCFLNGEVARLDSAVADGDSVVILQAVSGGTQGAGGASTKATSV